MKLSLSKFIGLLCEKTDKITPHSFFARSQSRYLAHLGTSWVQWSHCFGRFSRKLLIHNTRWNPGIPLWIPPESVLNPSHCCIMSEMTYLQVLPFDVSFFYKVCHETVAYIKKVLFGRLCFSKQKLQAFLQFISP